MRQQRNVIIRAHKKRQAQDPQVFTLALRVSPFRRLAESAATDEGIEVRGIKDEHLEIDVVAVNQLPGQLLLNRLDMIAVDRAHVIPEVLTGKRAFGRGQQSLQHRGAIALT